MLTKPATTNPELLALLEKSKERWKAMSDGEKREMVQAQRRSWVVGEMMLEHPDMTHEQAERLFDQII